MNRWLMTLACCALAVPLSAQTSVTEQREAMKKLEFMVGEWAGEGWTVTPDRQRSAFTQTEKIGYKLGGLALLIEGTGSDPVTGGIVFEAVADEASARRKKMSAA